MGAGRCIALRRPLRGVGVVGQQARHRLAEADRGAVLYQPLDDRAAPGGDNRLLVVPGLDVPQHRHRLVLDGRRDGVEDPAGRGHHQPPLGQLAADAEVSLGVPVILFGDPGSAGADWDGDGHDPSVGSLPYSEMSLRAASRSSGVLTACSVTPGRDRRAMPVSVPAGGSSISAWTPRPARVCWHWSQRTGAATWPTMRSSQSAPVVTTVPSRSDSSTICGSLTLTVPAAVRSASTAGAMCTVWKAPATDSGRSRALGGGSAANAASCSSVPAATT